MLSKTERKARSRVMERMHKTRINNMRKLVDVLGSVAELARRLAVSDVYIHQLCGINPVRSISEETARKMEIKLNLQTGWLDIERGGNK
jgi:hypothetical protein